MEKPPVEVQEVAFVELQINVDDWSLSIVLGFARSVTVGAHACVLQLWIVEPLHKFPPFAGEGFVQLLVWVPPPQIAEHVEKFDQPPSTGAQATGFTLTTPYEEPSAAVPPKLIIPMASEPHA